MSPRLARTMIFALLSRIGVGSLTIVESPERRRTFGAGSPTATVQVHDEKLWPMLLRGSRGLADAYAAGAWSSPDVVAVIRLAARNASALDRARRRLAPVRVPIQRARTAVRRNTRRQSRADIAAHYDLGNELFARMLDPTMMYSCAIFERPRMSLEQAQDAKLERICDKLDLQPGDRVLEIGSGWGTFAIHAAATRGCRVTTTTISREQFEHATAAVARAGLAHLVTVLHDDYRDLTGSYDKLVSIEMIEAVGWRQIGTFFDRCSRLLAADGAMLLQAITIDDRAYEVQKAATSFINTHIFPGGCLPSLEIIARHISRRTDMQLVDLEDITPHYVSTLRVWRENLEAHAEELDALGYDERFRRLWTLYLCYCEAGFAERRIGDVQIMLAKPDCRLAARAGRPAAALVPAGAARAAT